MKIEKSDCEHAENAYSVVIKADKGLVLIWFTSFTDRMVDFNSDIGSMNCVFLLGKDKFIITALWDTQADDFRSAFAKLTEETDNV